MKTLITAAVLVVASSTAVAGWDMPFMGNGNSSDNGSFVGNGTANGAGNGQGSADGSFEFAMSFKGTGKTDMKADTNLATALDSKGTNNLSTAQRFTAENGYAPVAPQAPATK